MNDKIISIFLICIVGPLLIYVGINKHKTPDICYNILGIIGLMIPFFMSTHKFELTTKDILYESHWLILLGFILLIAIGKTTVPLYIYDFLIYLGCFIIILHGYYLYHRFLLN